MPKFPLIGFVAGAIFPEASSEASLYTYKYYVFA